MDTKNMEFDPFDWIGKASNQGARYCKADISITLNKRSDKKESIHIIFRDGIHKMISDCMRIEVAPKKNRVYFRSNAKSGFKVTERPSNAGLKISNASIEILKNYIGDYDLQYDDYWELYYIQKGDN